VLAQRAIAITRVAQRNAAELVVPIVVLVEVYQGNRSDAAVDRLASRTAISVGLDLRTARLAGKLRTRAGVGSAVDAVGWQPRSTLAAASSQPATPTTCAG
jgi:hypothetical protein